MWGTRRERKSEPPEKVVERLLSLLKRHALWDSLLLFFPPLLVFFYLVAFLYLSAVIEPKTLVFTSAAVMGVALVFVFSRLRSVGPSLRFAARLVDEKVAGKDHFITLATIDQASCPSFLLTRVRAEAAGLLHRLDPNRDFPYRVKRSFVNGLLASLFFILLFQLFWQSAFFFQAGRPGSKELNLLAQKLSQVPRFSELARSLETLAVRIQEKGLSVLEKRTFIQDLLKQVENQIGAERSLTGTDKDLLAVAADLLRGLEQGLEKAQEQGIGGLQTRLPDQEDDQGREWGKGGGEKGEGGLKALGTDGLKSAESARDGQKEAKKKQGDKGEGGGAKSRQEGERGKEIESAAKGDMSGKARKYREQDIPRGAAPERFLKPGERGEQGLKGSRFVTVQLPEEGAEDSVGESESGKRTGLRPKVPISNVPLRRPDSPEAPPEKQPVPLEYRGLIR